MCTSQRVHSPRDEARQGVSIKDARDLHDAIARDIIGSPRPLRGQETRFLRSQLKLSQRGLAQILRQRRGSVARWEGEPDKKIPGAADSALRMFYALNADGHETARQLIELLGELDELEHGLRIRERPAAQFVRETDDGWMKAAA